MAKLKTNTPICRRLVHAFLDFLDSVEAAPGNDLEGLEVAKECLEEVFSINRSVDSRLEPDLLLNIFSSQEEGEQLEVKSDVGHEAAAVPSISSAQNAADANITEASRSLAEDPTSDPRTSEISEDDLFGQFFGALEKINYFKTLSNGEDDLCQLDWVSHMFQNAIAEMKESGCRTFDQKSLAETLKSQGNKFMQLKRFAEAIELYTGAIALCENNAVYYCNRAAAYTQVLKYTEAIKDCLKSIEIDPNYSKAYSRLGFAYYAQGNYGDAIYKGFLRALQLDPTNESVKENIRVAEQKLREQMQRNYHNQSSSSGSQGPGGAGSGPQLMYSSMSFGNSGVPADIASMFMNMASHTTASATGGGNTTATATATSTNSNGEISASATFTETGGNITIGGNSFNVEVSEPNPVGIGAFTSILDMFSGQAPQPQDNHNNNHRPSPPS